MGHFSKNIKYYRYKNSYFQEKLGELTDLSAKYISTIGCHTIDIIEKIVMMAMNYLND